MYMLVLDSGYKILVDCGMDYGQKTRDVSINNLFQFNPGDVDLVILTHAHVDHSGYLPALVAAGFNGNILCTPATCDLTAFLLFDSAKIQYQDYIRVYSRTRKSKLASISKPLFYEKDVKRCLEHFLTIPFNNKFVVNPQLSLSFIEAGHLLGAASIRMEITENHKKKIIGFTGDLGRKGSKLVKDPIIFDDIETIVTEATYGGRKHKIELIAEEDILSYINKTCIENRGRLIVPAFSVGRTQAIVFTLNQLKEKGLLPPWLKIYVDSPLAIKTTHVYRKYLDLLNDEARTFFETHGQLFEFDGLNYLEDEGEQEELMHVHEPCVIISAAGMVEGGRIQEHVLNNIENPFSTILIAGYCAEGTLGHKLLSGQSEIKIKNKDKRVWAQIAQTDVFSSHPDHFEILDYLTSSIKKGLKKIILIHGDESSLGAMKDSILETGFKNVLIPSKGDEIII